MNPGESLDAVVARIDERVAGLVQRFEAYTETEVMLRQDIATSREESRREVSAVRVDLERQIADVAADLAKHEAAVNPHPPQEDWLRKATDRLGSSIEGLRTDISGIRTDISNQHSTFTGAGKVLSALGAVGLVLIGGFINHLLGA